MTLRPVAVGSGSNSRTSTLRNNESALSVGDTSRHFVSLLEMSRRFVTDLSLPSLPREQPCGLA